MTADLDLQRVVAGIGLRLEIRDVRKRQETELFDCGLRLYSNPPALVLFQRAIAGEGHGGLRLLEDQVLATVWVFFLLAVRCWFIRFTLRVGSW